MPEITVERPRPQAMQVFRACGSCGALLEGTVVSEPGHLAVSYEPCPVCFPPELEREEC